MDIHSFQTDDQNSPHCVGPPHRKSRLRLMKAIRNPPTVQTDDQSGSLLTAKAAAVLRLEKTAPEDRRPSMGLPEI